MSHNATLHSSVLMASSSAAASSAFVTTVSPSISSSITTINTPYQSPTRPPTSMTSSATTATSATTSKPNAPSVSLASDDNSICRHAGVKKAFYTEMGDAYCRSRDGNGILCFGYT